LVALGGLQSIDPEIYEAARLDGARQDQIFWRITVPLLRPVLIFLLVTSSINVVTMFNQPYGIGGGAQGNPQVVPSLRCSRSTIPALAGGSATQQH
jgi:ABC-type sugar transport system permease subunit